MVESYGMAVSGFRFTWLFPSDRDAGRRAQRRTTATPAGLVAVGREPVVLVGRRAMVCDSWLLSGINVDHCLTNVGNGVADRVGHSLP